MTKNSQQYEKDGRYGWLIVLASFVVQFIALGIDFTFGIFYRDISKEFSQVGRGGTSWIPSILSAVAHAVGPVASILTNKYGFCTVSVLGSLFGALGFALSFFAQSPEIMYLTIGVIGGIGIGFLYLPAMVAVTQHFDKKLAFAMGVAVSGSGFGTLFFEWAFGLILFYAPWREGLLITAGIFLISLPFAFIYVKPTPNPKPVVSIEEEESQILAAAAATADDEDEQPHKSGKVAQFKQLEIKKKVEEEEEDKKVIKKALDLSLLKNVTFVLFAFADLLGAFAFNIPFVFLPEIEQTLTNSSSISLLGFIAVSSVVSRLVVGYLSDKKFINRYLIYTASLAFGGVATAACPQIRSIALLQANCAVYGACTGVYLSLKSVILVDLFGSDILADAFGLLLLVQALGICFGAPIAGFFYDNFGDYIFGFYFGGAVFLLSSLVLALIPLIQKRLKLVEKVGGTEDEKEGILSGAQNPHSGYSTFNESMLSPSLNQNPVPKTSDEIKNSSATGE